MTIMSSTETPEWVYEWLNIPFYEETPKCDTHKNKYLTVYCASCTEKLFCETCWKTEFVHHHAHPTVQVCIASHRAAVEKNVIKSVVDTSDIQEYIINHKKVVYLKPNDKAPIPPLPFDHRQHEHDNDRCRTCQRKLRDQASNFCSIACKVGIGLQCLESSKIMRKKRSCKGKETLFKSQLEENALVFEGIDHLEKMGSCISSGEGFQSRHTEKNSKMMTTKKRKQLIEPEEETFQKKESEEEKMMRKRNNTTSAAIFLKTKTLHRRKGIPQRSPFF